MSASILRSKRSTDLQKYMLEKAMVEKVFLCRNSELKESAMRQVAVAGIDASLVVYKVKGKVYATDALCTHGKVALTEGDLEGTTIYCPLHGGGFDVCTGKAVSPPCTVPLKTYSTVVEGDDIFGLLED
ncbi:non-heme iron oxygenase ferredoxin subunit [Acetobacter tropicalis]|uniref:non-heme iron oxygenase ferredoxin subunit n=1 Tax=Acetobacter TaxID=434 RepID=UPI001239A785|nr:MULTISPECIES: non-heme iron oxygenase ferredoxin subunit [Acetobacter]KAA8387272.1 non-heme iron oxygenase ferredoxin subunit [Acetobacter tropicalis]KAA8391042.1 non-heme iron oxygenase ferredoxin subunit [Acetobacter tropicalis]MBC9009739.1 non-heme iron oxygenase ferredoxin subunit [Acetobacter tropicalis]MCP1195621.1 non-heme iron oxygenase ferredoxin subunit [Acetobacter senegalensis]MDO8172505.1 non-heme iron oxygenase ferredoxin subunit [Acetobacter tropicalis]